MTDFLHLRVGDFSFLYLTLQTYSLLWERYCLPIQCLANKKNMNKEIILANPRGFCVSVDRAIEIVEKSLEKFNEPVFVRYHVVHNKNVATFRIKGSDVCGKVHEIPDNSIAIFSAHGVSSEVEDSAKLRKFKYFDATCPLVTKVHLEANMQKRSRYCIN